MRSRLPWGGGSPGPPENPTRVYDLLSLLHHLDWKREGPCLPVKTFLNSRRRVYSMATPQRALKYVFCILWQIQPWFPWLYMLNRRMRLNRRFSLVKQNPYIKKHPFHLWKSLPSTSLWFVSVKLGCLQITKVGATEVWRISPTLAGMIV